jgi:endonuclease G
LNALLLLLALGSGPATAHDWRVVGGHPADPGDWPDAVAVYAGNQYRCTGVLVASDVVLTAAHCDWGLTKVILDTVDHTEGGEEIAISYTVTHPRSWTTYDVSALVLSEESSVTPRMMVQACLLDTWLNDEAPVAIVGWGATDEWATQETTELYEAFSSVVDHDCSSLDRGCNPEVSPGGELIAGGEGVDSCNGDSGGPLYLLTDEGAFLAGITSRATTDATVLCGDGGIYVRADAVLDWVESETGREVPRPDCAAPRNRAPEPVADPVRLAQGETTSAWVHPNDPDEEDSHTWEVLDPPIHGTAAFLPDGELRYTANSEYVGEDGFTVLVTDDGQPPLSAPVEVRVDVLPIFVERGTCACAGTGGPGGSLLLFWAVIVAVRRRAATR